MKVQILSTATAACCCIVLGSAGAAFAQTEPAPAPKSALGAVSRALTDGALERKGIAILGWAEGTAAISDNDSDSLSPGGFFNQDAGLNLNQVGLMLCRTTGCPPEVFGPGPLANRIGPFPGPKRDTFDIGFNVTALYGEDVQFLRTLGFDDYDFDEDDDNKLAITQAFVDIQTPLLAGTSFLVGSFQTSLAGDIGYPFNPPNWFATKTYAFQHGPAKHVGVLAQTVLPTSPEFGLLSVEYGLVRGWNNWEDANDDVDFIGGLRYRSPDFRTWVDFEIITGNGENDFGPGAATGGSPYFALSSTGEELRRTVAFLVLTQQLANDLSLGVETTYGVQEGGDVAAGPMFIVEDASWYGANVSLRKQLNPKVAVAARAEWFKDEEGAHVLWAGSPGSIAAVTGNVEWQVHPHLRLRGEVRYDTFEGDDGAAPIFDEGQADDQAAAYFNVFVPF